MIDRIELPKVKDVVLGFNKTGNFYYVLLPITEQESILLDNQKASNFSFSIAGYKFQGSSIVIYGKTDTIVEELQEVDEYRILPTLSQIFADDIKRGASTDFSIPSGYDKATHSAKAVSREKSFIQYNYYLTQNPITIMNWYVGSIGNPEHCIILKLSPYMMDEKKTRHIRVNTTE